MSPFIQIADGLAILMEMQRIYRDALRRDIGHANVEIDWQSLSPYVVDNGPVKILPLARSAGGQEADEQIGAVGPLSEGTASTSSVATIFTQSH